MARIVAEELRDIVERALLRKLSELWVDLNWRYFSDRMYAPALELSDAETWLGRWFSSSRTISISRRLAFEHPWDAVEEVMRHEMAHQFVEEVLGKDDETAHGPAFRQTCELLGIDASASGLPKTSALDGAAARVVEKIGRLLTLAASPNQHEAEAAAVAARKLMLKHNLDVVSAPKRYEYRRLGAPTGRVEESARILAGILARHFFVEALWVPTYGPSTMKRGTVLEIMGTPENLAIAEYVYAFLTHSAESLWRAHQAERGVRSNRDRRTFHAGVMAGFREKLETAHKTEVSRALVWVRDPELDVYLRKRHPRITTRATGGRARNASFHEGRNAGKRLVLSKSISTTAVARGRLLGPGKV